MRGELETLAANFALGLYDALHKAAVQRHAECPSQRKPPDHPGMIVTYIPPQKDILAWREIVGAELASGMAEGRKALRGNCLDQIALRPWLKTFAPLMSEDCVAVDRHRVGLFLHASFDQAQVLARRPRAMRR